ncbi:MAG: DUF4957 domain-containing protein [Bacteroidales bacterium]|nr:DUF4957 domain-containing protein [Bacteroidales bacterium]
MKKIVFADDCAISKLGKGMFYHTDPMSLTDVEVKTTVPLTIASGAFFYWGNGSTQNFTITAPSIAAIGNEPIYNYYKGSLNIVFQTEEPITFDKGLFSNLEEGSTVSILKGAKLHTPSGYAFTDPEKQDLYDDMARDGEESMFWEYEGRNLVEGTDYTRTEEKTEDLTAENASQVFGGATVTFVESFTSAEEPTVGEPNGASEEPEPDPIELTTENGTEWTLSEMPGYDVELEVEYYTQDEVDQIKADEVEAKIYAIGTAVEYTAECKAKIDDARTGYDALTETQKGLVENYAMLEAAEARYQELAPVPEDIHIAPERGADIYTALMAAEEGKLVKDIYIELTKGGEYTISGSIAAPANLYIWGHGATVDASALEGAMTTLVAVENPTEWTTIEHYEIKDVTIKNLGKALFASPCKNYLIESLEIDNVNAELTADVTTIDFTKGSVANVFVSNSTFWAATATTKSFYSSQSAQKMTDAGADLTQTFWFGGNTMYNLAKGKNFFSHRSSNQTWMVYDVEDNIFVNCGKSGQTIKGMNGGQGGTNPTWTIKNNVFNFEGEDTSTSEVTGDADEPITGTVAGVVAFTDADNGDFNGELTLGEGVEVPEILLGDLRWTITITKPVVTGVKDVVAEGSKKGGIYNLSGVKLAKPQRGVNVVDGKLVIVK